MGLSWAFLGDITAPSLIFHGALMEVCALPQRFLMVYIVVCRYALSWRLHGAFMVVDALLMGFGGGGGALSLDFHGAFMGRSCCVCGPLWTSTVL